MELLIFTTPRGLVDRLFWSIILYELKCMKTNRFSVRGLFLGEREKYSWKKFTMWAKYANHVLVFQSIFNAILSPAGLFMRILCFLYHFERFFEIRFKLLLICFVDKNWEIDSIYVSISTENWLSAVSANAAVRFRSFHWNKKSFILMFLRVFNCCLFRLFQVLGWWLIKKWKSFTSFCFREEAF